MKKNFLVHAAVLLTFAHVVRANTNTLYITNFTDVVSVRSATNFNIVLGSTANSVTNKGYALVKYDPGIAPTNTGSGDAKAYFRFDFASQGLTPNTNVSIKLAFRHVANGGAEHVQLWALNQQMPTDLSTFSWATAPGNDTNGWGMLTNGTPYTATLLGDIVGGISTSTPDTFTLSTIGPQAWGNFLFNGQIVFVLTTPDNVGQASSKAGERYSFTNAPTKNPSVDFFDTTGPQPPNFITNPTNITVFAHHSGSVSLTLTNDPAFGGNTMAIVSAVTTGSSTNVVPPATLTATTPDASGNSTINFTAGVDGTATVKVYISTTNNLTNSTSFTVTALPNPQIVASPDTNGLLCGATYSGTAVVSSVDMPLSLLSVTMSNQNPNMAYSGITFTGNGSNRLVNFTAPTGTNGLDVLFLTVTDTNNYTYTDDFWVMVRPSRSVLFNDHFDYPTNSGFGYGTLTTASDGAWYARGSGSVTIRNTNLCSSCVSGIAGTVALLRQSSTGIPLIADLADGSFPIGHHTKIYTKFSLMFNGGVTLSNNSGAFVHLWDGSNIVCGVTVCTNSPNAGQYRLAVVNSSRGLATNNNVFPLDIVVGTAYTVVTRYDLDSQTSTLWINPSGENDTSVTASDTVTNPLAVISVGLRQDSGLFGDTFVDDLVVAKDFASATGIGTPPPVITGFQKNGGNVTVNFYGSTADSAGSFKLLQSTNASGPFQTNGSATINSGASPGDFSTTVGSAASWNFFRVQHN